MRRARVISACVPARLRHRPPRSTSCVWEGRTVHRRRRRRLRCGSAVCSRVHCVCLPACQSPDFRGGSAIRGMRTLLEAGLEGQTWTRTVLLTPGMAASGIEVPLRRTAAAAAGGGGAGAGGATMMSVGDSASSSMMMSRSFSSPATLSSPPSVRSPASAASGGDGGEQQQQEAEAEAEEAEAEAEVRDSQLQEWLELSLRGELVEGIAEPAAEFRRGFLEVRAGIVYQAPGELTIRRGCPPPPPPPTHPPSCSRGWVGGVLWLGLPAPIGVDWC
jgi:hypothetical protein